MFEEGEGKRDATTREVYQQSLNKQSGLCAISHVPSSAFELQHIRSFSKRLQELIRPVPRYPVFTPTFDS